METKHLRTLVTIVELSSFTRAGVQLGLSQSAISQQIGMLERQLGVRLLRRSGAGVRPTAAGELLVDHARQILTRIETARRLVCELETSPGGLLRIAANGAACRHLLPDVLAALRESFPRIELHVWSGHTDLTLGRLVVGDADVGLVTLPAAHPKLRLAQLGRDELVLVAPATHRFAASSAVEPAELAGEPLLVSGRRSRTFQLLERTLLEAGVFPRVAMEVGDSAALGSMVAHGLGVAVVPRWAIAGDLAGGDVVTRSLGAGALSRTWAVAFLEESQPRQALRAFVRLCTDRVPARLAAAAQAAPAPRAAPGAGRR
jgi:DNA-binding transcriptional LysR family regulator